MNSSSDSRPKRIGIIQSNYIPWKGYFDFIDSVDEFVLFDEVQFTRRDWRNRNRIKAQHGLAWLTIPVESKGRYHDPIDAIGVSGGAWINEHLERLKHSYARAPRFRLEWEWVCHIFDSVREKRMLSDINEALIRAICEHLGICTPIRRSRDLNAPAGKNERLISICKSLGATEYLSGPAARDYIDQDAWRERGISVHFKSYNGYPEYDQVNPPFEHGVSILDVILHCGDDAKNYIKGTNDVEG